jgi:hypothetical protein
MASGDKGNMAALVSCFANQMDYIGVVRQDGGIGLRQIGQPGLHMALSLD